MKLLGTRNKEGRFGKVYIVEFEADEYETVKNGFPTRADDMSELARALESTAHLLRETVKAIKPHPEEKDAKP